MSKQNHYHAIRIRDNNNGISRWYNECGLGPLNQARLFPIRLAGSDNPWGQEHGESDAQPLFARLDGIFYGSTVHIAIVEVIPQWRMRRHLLCTENGRRKLEPEIVEHDGRKWVEAVQVERRIVRDLVE